VADLELRPVEGISVRWDLGEGEEPAGDDAALPGWSLDGSLDGFSALRVVTASARDGQTVCLCAVRPAGAEHHDEEAVVAAVVGADGTTGTIEEALVSTEYGADGSIRRLGLELYKAGEDYPMRAAGDTAAASSSTDDRGRRDRAEMRFRIDGSEGTAIYEIVHAA
jgi:hypothetical protein